MFELVKIIVFYLHKFLPAAQGEKNQWVLRNVPCNKGGGALFLPAAVSETLMGAVTLG